MSREPHLPSLAGQLRRHARQAGAVAAGAVRAGGGAALARTARRSATCSAFVSGLYFRGKLTYARRFAAPPDPSNADRRRRRPRHHAERRAAQPGHAGDARGRARVRARRRRRRTTRRTAGRSKRSARTLLAEIGPDCDVVLLGSVASPKYVDVLGRHLRRAAAVPDRLRRPRRHEPRRAAAAAGARRRRARVRAGRRRRPPRRASAEAAAARSQGSARRPASDILPPSPAAMRLTHSARPGQRHPDRRREGGPADQPPQDLLAGARPHQGRPAAVLRRRRRRAAAAPARSRDGDEALPARRRRRVLLHEARADAAARLDRDLLDRARHRATSSTFR